MGLPCLLWWWEICVLFTWAMSTQLVTFSTRSLMGVDVADGRLLWSRPFYSFGANTASPLVIPERNLIVVSGYDQGVQAVQVERSEQGEWTLGTVWEQRDLTNWLVTPVLDGRYLLGFSQRRSGLLFCLDVVTGQRFWQTRGREGQMANSLRWGPWLLVQGGRGRLSGVRSRSKRAEAHRELHRRRRK